MTNDALYTPRLQLRPLRADDLPALFAIQGDTDAMQHTFCPATPEASAENLLGHEAQRDEIGIAPWVAVLRETGEIVGWGGLFEDPFDPGWGVEVGYFFAREVWGRGLATELVEAALAHGFVHLDLSEIKAFSRPANEASHRVLERAGFVHVGYEPRLERNAYRVTRIP